MGKVKYFFTKEELENKLKELKTPSKMARYYNIPNTSMRWLCKKFNIPMPSNAIKFNDQFFSKDTPESFYLAGFLAADGNIQKNKNRITLGLGEKDKDFLYKIKDLIEFEGLIYKKIDYGSRRKSHYKDTVSYSLRFSSAKTVNDLKRFGIVPAKSKILEFPEWIIDHPLVNHFLRGYFDGDGCARVTDKTQLSFKINGTTNFLLNYKNILIKHCQVNNNKIGMDKGIGCLSYRGNFVSPRIYEYLYNNSTFHLERKYNIYINHMKKYNSKL